MKRALGFALAVLVQLAILAYVPWPQVRARTSGTEVILSTGQYDPYDHFSGHYVALRYEVENIPHSRLDGLPRNFFIGLRPDEKGIWRSVGEAADPSALPPATVALKAINNQWSASIGMSRYYMPEERRNAINAALEAERGETDAIRVRARIGPDGTAALVSLIVGGAELNL